MKKHQSIKFYSPNMQLTKANVYRIGNNVDFQLQKFTH